MRIFLFPVFLAVLSFTKGYVIHDVHHPRNTGIQSTMPTKTHSVVPIGTIVPDVRKHILDGSTYVGDSCYRVTDEYEVTLNFDEVHTDGKMVFPGHYANLKWSCRFRIFNETEQTFPPQNHATSHPNLLFADNKRVDDPDCNDDGMDPWIAIDNSDPTKPLRVFDLISVRHQPLYGLHVPVLIALKQTYITGAFQKNGTRYYSHAYQSTLSYPYQIDARFEHLVKLEFMVIPSGNHRDPSRHPFFLDDMKLRFKELMPMEGCMGGRPHYNSKEL